MNYELIQELKKELDEKLKISGDVGIKMSAELFELFQQYGLIKTKKIDLILFSVSWFYYKDKYHVSTCHKIKGFNYLIGKKPDQKFV